MQLNLTRGEDNVIGTLVRPGLQCAANLKVLTQQSDQLIARQDRLYGGGNCVSDQLVVIRRTAGQMSVNFGTGDTDLPLTSNAAAGSSLLKPGVYSAVAVQRNPAASYALQLVVSQTAQGAVVSALYPDQGCASRLQFQRNEGNVARFTEQVQHGTCLNGGTVRLDIQAGTGNLRYQWSKNEVPATVEAFLRPGALPRK
ncbi:hypothetical protein DC3_08080 [Deinococcus cellulosilyticus NBRC 106333 = KACC 11606]|uniref:Uncharacterized protein n=1 Tax=Deinococcus cellulosilyticus (strain DSM 18568 / NBRC 106333 / KACC 11606 / 5516J-15) TaxID=1223518 RepID=A0A511MX68_DEIC1|nr:hypothetical protein DC3_08080 [Deinococcus cellulosilyticus NBRC 106333 = KACC 11606]